MTLKKEELKQIKGGFDINLFAGVGAIVSFIISVISGIVNPVACKWY